MWPQSYLHSWRKKPQGVEYVDPGESIQQALDRAHFVILAEGEHSAPSGLTLKANQRFSGVGKSSKLELGGTLQLADDVMLSDLSITLKEGFANNSFAIRAQDVENIVVRDIVLDGNVLLQTYGPTDNGQIGIGLVGGTSDVVIENCKICNFSKDCVYLENVSDVQIGKSSFLNFARGGVTIVDGDAVHVWRCLFSGGADLPTVIGNHGLWLEPDNGDARFTNLKISGCTFRDLQRGLYLHNAQECPSSIAEEGNTFERCAFVGVWGYYTHSLLSKNSSFEDCGNYEDEGDTGPSDTEGAVVVFRSLNARILDHRFKNCGGFRATVYLGDTTRGCSVEGNTFEGDQKSAVYAATFAGGKTRRRFARNVCMDGSKASAGEYAAFVLAGTAQNPIDTDDVVENTVEHTYSGVVSSTQWTGGRNEFNRLIEAS